MTVTMFLALINQTLEFAYPQVVIEGEVSSFKVNQGKWVFFDLKDDESTISCFMTIYQLKVALEDGMLVRVTARPNVTKWGKFSLTVQNIELAGEGSVKRAFELLKQQFEAEGLFAPERKRELPQFPQRIALITSNQAAAYNDFLKIISERWPHLAIDQFQVQVQGESAPDSIVAAITQANNSPLAYDVAVIIRGGGSLEDLQAFNREDVVRAIFGSKLPTLVAIGHEDDVSLAELAADVRGATPTDAARLLTPDQREIISSINHYQQRSLSAMQQHFYSAGQTIVRLHNVFSGLMANLKHDVRQLENQLLQAADQSIWRAAETLRRQQQLLRSLNPLAVLQRGYSIATVNGRVIKAPAQIQKRDTVVLQLADGKVNLKKQD